ncbi:transposase [Pseudomonas sp. NA-150]|uniref:transposase n=1 Tax=Pseudomonas sp. NA-150 TaxID=3367525 RepID=UPI0037C94CFD
MPRKARVVLPGYPHHVVQRGHNRQVVFAHEDDFTRYLNDLRELKEALGVKVYAYCLMTNHVHLLLAPQSSSGLGELMKALAARMTRYRNKLEHRSGTLWESRYKSSLVQSDSYLLACSRYIELNPVRARMVEHAGDYPWSSFNLRFTSKPEADWLDTDPAFEALGSNRDSRHQRYQTFIEQAVSPDELKIIRNALQRGQLTGTERFVTEVESIIGRRIESRSQGRPRSDDG